MGLIPTLGEDEPGSCHYLGVGCEILPRFSDARVLAIHLAVCLILLRDGLLKGDLALSPLPFESLALRLLALGSSSLFCRFKLSSCWALPSSSALWCSPALWYSPSLKSWPSWCSPSASSGSVTVNSLGVERL